MGHDIHFLSRLERVSEEEVSLALSLYRNVPFVREVLSLEVPDPGIQRVALALDSSPAPPFVVVERSGAFVTCLGAGMKADNLPIITRAALERHVRLKVEWLKEEEAIQELHSWGKNSYLPLLKGAERLDRETYSAYFATRDLIRRHTLQELFWLQRQIIGNQIRLARRERLRPSDDSVLRDTWGLLWRVSHFVPLLAGIEKHPHAEHFMKFVELSLYGVNLSGFIPVLCRSLWTAARIGKPLLPLLKSSYGADSPPAQSLMLCALGLAHSKLTGEVRKLIEKQKGLNRQQELLQLLDDPGSFRPALTRFVEGPPEDNESPESEPPREISAVDERLVFATLPAHIDVKGAYEALLGALPEMVRGEIEDLYMPRDTLKLFEPYDIRALMAHACRFWGGVSPPVRIPEEERLGRNEPCKCGSGRKFKKCCG